MEVSMTTTNTKSELRSAAITKAAEKVDAIRDLFLKYALIHSSANVEGARIVSGEVRLQMPRWYDACTLSSASIGALWRNPSHFYTPEQIETDIAHINAKLAEWVAYYEASDDAGKIDLIGNRWAEAIDLFNYGERNDNQKP
jgi:hypothetical protein